MRPNRFSPDIWAHACFDPGTLMLGSMVATGAGGLLSAGGTLAGGNAAAAAGQMQKASADYQATQDTQNAAQAFASGQRQMLDTQQKTRLAISSARAGEAAAGTNAGSGSAANIQGVLAKRGSYNAAMDMFNGASASTGLLNKAAGETYSGEAAEIGGEEAQSASELAAAGTLAGAAGSMAKTYGQFTYPGLSKSA